MSRAAGDQFARSPSASRSRTRMPSRDSWTGCCAEARASKLARLHEPDEERVELVVLVIAPCPEPRHRLGAEASEHLEPLPENASPLLREVFREDGREAGARQEPAVALEALDGHRGHPLFQSPPLIHRQQRGGHPVAEGETSPRHEHAGALDEDPRLVGDVEKSFLAHHGGEGRAREGKGLGIGADHTHEAAETDEGDQAPRTGRLLGREIDAGHAGGALTGHEAGRTGQPRTDIEHVALRGNARPARQSLDRSQSAVMVLIPAIEVLRGKLSQVLALAAQRVEDLILANWVLSVEDGGRNGTVHAQSLRWSAGSGEPLNPVGACGTTGGVSTLCAEEIRHAMSDAPANPMKAGLEDVVVS